MAPLMVQSILIQIHEGEFFFLIFLMIVGMAKEKIKKIREKNVLKESKPSQLPDAHTSFKVPMKKVKINVPAIMPMPVPMK